MIHIGSEKKLEQTKRMMQIDKQDKEAINKNRSLIGASATSRVIGSRNILMKRRIMKIGERKMPLQYPLRLLRPKCFFERVKANQA